MATEVTKISARLAKLHPGGADFLEAASWMMSTGSPLPATTNLVAHCMREIESAVRSVVSSVVTTPYKKSGKDDQVKEILHLSLQLGLSEDDENAIAWRSFAGSETLKPLHAMAHRPNLERTRPLDQEFRDRWSTFLTWLTHMVDVIERRTDLVYRQIDLLLAKNSSQQDICQSFKTRIPQNEHTLAYFLVRLSGVDWLTALSQAHFFDNPPRVIRSGTGYGYESWPPSQYLASIAQASTDFAPQITQILLGLLGTDNPAVRADAIRTALSLPSSSATTIVQAVKRWMTGPFISYEMPELILDLIEHLADGMQGSEAEELTWAALRTVKPSRGKQKQRQARALFDAHSLASAVPRIVRALSVSATESTLVSAAKVLREVTRKSGSRRGEKISDDFSTMWRGNIAGDDYPWHPEAESLLLDLVRDLSLAMIASGHEANGIIRTLLTQPSGALRRVGIWLASERLELTEAISGILLARPDRWDVYPYEQEFWMLARSASVTNPQLVALLVRKLPSRLEYRKRLWSDVGYSSEQVHERAERWWHVRLNLLRPVLDQEGLSELHDLDQKLGKVGYDPLRRPKGYSFIVGSPLDSEQIGQMTVREIVEFGRTFQDASGRTGISELYHVVSGAIATDASKFQRDASLFAQIGSEHVASVLRGFADAVRSGQTIEWGGILLLIDEVIEYGLSAPGDEAERASWPCVQAANLISMALQAVTSGLGESELGRMSGQLFRLMQHIDPRAGRELDEGLVGVYWNSVRGVTFDAYVWLALRTAQERLPWADHSVGAVIRTVEEIVREGNRTLLYGAGLNLPKIHSLSPEASELIRNSVMSPDAEPSQFLSAWSGYLDADKYRSLDRLLALQYLRAIDLLVAGADHKPRDGILTQLLNTILYLALIEGEASYSDLLATCLARSSDRVRAWMHDQLRIFLFQNKDALRLEQRDGIAAYIQERARVCLAVPADSPSELLALAQVVGTGIFDDTWSLELILTILDVTNLTEHLNELLRFLSKVAATNPELSVRCLLKLMLQREPGAPHGLSDYLERILVHAETSTSEDAIAMAHEVRNRLAAEFGPRFLATSKPHVQGA